MKIGNTAVDLKEKETKENIFSYQITRIFGDNLVDVKSALGQHKKTAKKLNFKEENTWIVYENNHLELLSNPKILDKLKTWLV